ncbi:unnamed protein product [Gongylonema pulchrum]|uniref:SpoU_methylase domain-containing protein n=1 Tax=Gongylonema pulchrum TaxID=637853 RepID=A0A183D5H9_9BILA|nr:unnamed protein product [Gongylonema pulchrum]
MLVGEETEGVGHDFETASVELSSCLQVLAAPSSFGVVAFARAIVLRYPFIS